MLLVFIFPPWWWHELQIQIMSRMKQNKGHIDGNYIVV